MSLDKQLQPYNIIRLIFDAAFHGVNESSSPPSPAWLAFLNSRRLILHSATAILPNDFSPAFIWQRYMFHLFAFISLQLCTSYQTAGIQKSGAMVQGEVGIMPAFVRMKAERSRVGSGENL